MALLDANAVALQTSFYMLLNLSLLILAGNTCFPPFLRLILMDTQAMRTPRLPLSANSTLAKNTRLHPRPPPSRLHQPLPLQRNLVVSILPHNSQRHRLVGIRGPKPRQQGPRRHPTPLSSSRRAFPSFRRTIGRFLRCSHLGPLPRYTRSLRPNDVPQRLPHLHHRTQHKCIRRALSRYIRQRPDTLDYY